MNKKNNIVNPTGLKGEEQMSHIRGLMGKLSTISESTKAIPSISISKNAPDGNVYAIIKENQDYFIKVAKQSDNLTVHDFNYIGGLKNKRSNVFESYNKATKSLNNKLISLFETYNVKGNIDTFHTDNLVSEENGTNGGSMGFMSEEDTKKMMDEADDLILGDEAENPEDDCNLIEDPEGCVTNESIIKKQSLLESLNSDGDILPPGYKELMFVKKKV